MPIILLDDRTVVSFDDPDFLTQMPEEVAEHLDLTLFATAWLKAGFCPAVDLDAPHGNAHWRAWT